LCAEAKEDTWLAAEESWDADDDEDEKNETDCLLAFG
jgi:hypothetical protein